MRYKSAVWLVTWWNIVYVTVINSLRSRFVQMEVLVLQSLLLVKLIPIFVGAQSWIQQKVFLKSFLPLDCETNCTRSVSNGKVTQEDTVTIRPTSSEHQKNFTEEFHLTEDFHGSISKRPGEKFNLRKAAMF